MRTKLIGASLICLALIITAVLIPRVNAQRATNNSLAKMVAEYHVSMNTEVDQQLRKLKTILDELAQAQTAKERTAIRTKHFGKLGDSECRDAKVGKDNLSVYCFGLKLNDRKQDFASLVASYGDLGNAANREQALAAIAQAELVLGKTVNAYSQILLSQIYHQENLLALDASKDLADHLEELEAEVKLLPIKFTNVSTTKCQWFSI